MDQVAKSMNDSPIGIFDSGLGGLSVWREVVRELPGESVIYFGDGLRCPYGSRPVEEITEFSREAVQTLVDKGAKLIVVACNTATAAAITLLRREFALPIVGMEPAVKPAALSTRTGKIVILATEASLRGDHYRRTASQYGHSVELIPVAGAGMVELVENDLQNTRQAQELIRGLIEPALAAGADRVVLGCTHYSLLAEDLEAVIAGRAQLVDSAPAVERRVAQLLHEHGLAARADNCPVYEFVTLAGDDYRDKLVRKASRLRGNGFSG